MNQQQDAGETFVGFLGTLALAAGLGYLTLLCAWPRDEEQAVARFFVFSFLWLAAAIVAWYCDASGVIGGFVVLLGALVILAAIVLPAFAILKMAF